MEKILNVCGHCSILSSLSCSNCKKVSYCSKEHQKLNRKNHKVHCFPAKLKWSQNLGNHLQATRDIEPGEIIFEEEPLIIGPRSNLPKFAQVCLGCCNLVETKDACQCPHCRCVMCTPSCHENYWHREFECKIFTESKHERPSNEDEFLFVTILRCLLMKYKNVKVWKKFTQFVSHENSRRRESSLSIQTHNAVHFIQKLFNHNEFDVETIDRIYGVLLINGYSDASRYFVKLYELGSKISHSCLPNTRSISQDEKTLSAVNDNNKIPTKLSVISTVKIKQGDTLTQLYGNFLQGIHQRQQFLQRVYYFTCSCQRCQDPSECGTYFSAVFCKSKKCIRRGKVVLPSANESSIWKCANCEKKWSYTSLVVPALSEVTQMCGMSEEEPLYSEFEVYSQDNSPLCEKEAIAIKSDHVIKICQNIKELGKTVVHPNHFALIPLKTGVIATIYSIIYIIQDRQQRDVLLELFISSTKDVLAIFDILSPGLTRNRGIVLFYLARGLQMLQLQNSSTKNENLKEVLRIWKEAELILLLEPKSDTYRQLLEKQNELYTKDNSFMLN